MACKCKKKGRRRKVTFRTKSGKRVTFYAKTK